MRNFYLYLLLGFLLCTLPMRAQRDTSVQYYFEKFTLTLDSGKLDESYLYFKKMAALKSTLPDEVAFYYGKLTFLQGKLGQSKSAFDKFIQLKGDSCSLCKEAISYLDKIHCQEKGYKESNEICQVCVGAKIVPEDCFHCNKTGMELCTLCKGNGVYIEERDGFGKKYQTCPKCNGNKYVVCSVCKGTRLHQVFCPECKGIGKKRIKIPCHE